MIYLPKELAEECLCEGLIVEKGQPLGGIILIINFLKTRSNFDAV